MAYEPRKKRELSEEEKEERAASKRLARKMVTVLAIAFVVLVGLELVSRIDFDSLLGPDTPKTPDGIRFEYADFEEDILTDATYLDKTRLMAYRKGAQMTLINEDDYINYDPAVNMMRRYFDILIHGDLEQYNTLFTAEYQKQHKLPRTEPFTMQRIYDMTVEYVTEVDQPDTDLFHTYFLVEYKIQKNNGTFRADMGSDCTRAQAFELIWDTETRECFINQVCYPSELKIASYE